MTKDRCKILFLIFSFQSILINMLYSQIDDLKFEYITTEQGLSSNAVYDITQDQHGFMWFATRDGLNRFDGIQIKEFKYSSQDSHSIAANWCSSIHEDRYGNLWIGTLYGGLNRFDPVNERFIAFKYDPENPHTISNDVVLAISEDDSGNFWLGTWHGLNFLHHKYIENPDQKTAQFVHYNHDPNNSNSLSDDRIWSLCIDSKGIIWVGTDAGGLNRFDPTTEIFKHYQHDLNDPQSLRDNHICCIYEDPILKSRTLWVGTRMRGLHKFIVAEEIFEHEKFAYSEFSGWGLHTVTSVCRNRDGYLWSGTWGGLKRYLFKNIEAFTQKYFLYKKNNSKISHDQIKTIYEDRSGILWLGTVDGGINKVSFNKVRFHEHLDVGGFCIYEDQSGVLWSGGWPGVHQLDHHKDLIFTYAHRSDDSTSISSKEVYAIVEEPNCADQTLWILCRDGGLDKLILKLNPSSGLKEAMIHHILPIRSDSISQACKYGLALVRDKNGILWIGANEGLFRFDPKSFKVTAYQSDTSDAKTQIKDRVERIYQSPFDTENILWLGTSNGLYQVNLDQKKVTHYKSDLKNINSLSDNRVISLLADTPSEGKIFWIGTFSGGLNRFDIEQRTFRRYTLNEGLPSNTIYSILQDDSGNLWLGTDNGLTKFNPRTKTHTVYGFEDNLNLIRFYPGGAFKSSRTGEMFFAGDGGFISFYPDSIIDNAHIPTIVLTDFKVFNKNIKIDTTLTNIKQIKLPYDQNFFSFHFAALDFTNPSENQYAYQLQGLDRAWVYAGNRNIAYYTDVKPGTYYFRVKGSNNDGVWNEKVTSVKIIITPPFWRTWWFYSLLGILCIGLLVWGYYIRVSRLIKQRNAQQAFSKQLIEAGEKERKRIANELHDSLGQNLLITKNEITECLNAESLPEVCARNLKEVSSLVSDSIKEVREIAYNLHPHQLDRLGLTKAIESIVNKVSNSSAPTFALEIENVDGLFPKDQEIHIYRIVQEGLNNVIKHANAKNVLIEITRSDDALKILINDDGKGFNLKRNESEPIPSSGLGLAGIAERTKILNGEWTIETARKNGTSLKITIPITEIFTRSNSGE